LKRKNNGKKIFIITLLIIALWILGIYMFITYQNIEIDSNYEASKTSSTNYAQTVESVQENSTTIADTLEQVTKSVVGISKLKNAGSSILSSSTEDELGLGTGIIVSEKGYVLSNSHVTGEKYSNCYITLENGITYTGTVVWADSDLDLSITKISANNLNKVELGDSKSIRQGETVYAIGNPIGFEFRRTVTSGIISAVNRTIKLEESGNVSYMSDLIQTDATINPGNSGGPLIQPDGKVIGINTVKISSAEGIGFAIPINVIKPIIESFDTTDNFSEASIGIYAFDKEVIPYLNSSTSFEKGIYVAQITANSPASKAELKEEDIINSIDGVELNTMNDLREYIYTKKPGESVTLNITRGKITKQIEITLGYK
jgi:S1-C subfamily serine protease